MNLTKISSQVELEELLPKSKKTYVLLHKKSSTQSECAIKALQNVEIDSTELKLYEADVSTVRDIHPNYGIKSVPSLMEFEGGKLKNVLKGCLGEAYYKSYFENIIYELKAENSDQPSKNVTVYTTPTCPWCTTVKNYLKKNGVRYSEVDVASDQNAAQSMVSKSGQQGVPQTEINGEMVIGFDQTKLKRLLEL